MHNFWTRNVNGNMASKSLLVSASVLRVLALLFLGASMAVLVTNKVKLSDGSTTTFKDIISYRYVVAISAVAFVYTLFQIPFAIYLASTEKRLIKNECFPEFDFYADKMIGFLVAIAVGAGLAVALDLKKFLKESVDILEALGFTGLEDDKSKNDKFLDRASVAIGILFLAFLCMALLSIFTSILKKPSTRSLFG